MYIFIVRVWCCVADDASVLNLFGNDGYGEINVIGDRYGDRYKLLWNFHLILLNKIKWKSAKW